MSREELIDIVQTLALMFVCLVLAYAVNMVGRAMKGAMRDLRHPLLVVVRDHEQIRKQLTAQSLRIEALEARMAAVEAKG